MIDGSSEPFSFPEITDPNIFEEVIHSIYSYELSEKFDQKDVPFLIDLLKASNYLGAVKLKLAVEALLSLLVDSSNFVKFVDVFERLA